MGSALYRGAPALDGSFPLPTSHFPLPTNLFANNCYGQVLSRVWFLSDNVYRKFLFFDVGYSRKVSQLKVSSYLRAHYALTIKDRKDPDFLRWGTTLSLITFKKVQSFLFVEPLLLACEFILKNKYVRWQLRSRSALNFHYLFKEILNR